MRRMLWSANRNLFRPLTSGEIALGRSIFGDAIEYGRVRVHPRKWLFFMPDRRPHAPNGHLYFPLGSGCYADDLSRADLRSRAAFVHELAHVWQHQRGVNVILRAALNRSYDYRSVFHGRPFAKLGVEAQAKMVADFFLLRCGVELPDRPPLAAYERLLPFRIA